MKTSIYNLLLAGLVSGVIFAGCSKADAVNDLNNNAQQIPTDNNGSPNMAAIMLNRDLQIVYATDGQNDMSGDFTDHTVRFQGAQPTGEAIVSNGETDQTGTWSSAPASSAFVMDFPDGTSSRQVKYLERQWTMQPGTSADMIKLTAADGDQIMMSAK